MLAISRQTDYACRILLHLASEGSGRVTAAGVAEQQRIPPALIRRIVTTLAGAGLIRTMRGSTGGIALARPASQISLLDAVQAMEGPLALNPCTIACSPDPDACPLIPACPVHEAWISTRAVFMQELSQTTFDKLAARGQLLSSMTVKEEA
jgi:Rrf2 family protein